MSKIKVLSIIGGLLVVIFCFIGWKFTQSDPTRESPAFANLTGPYLGQPPPTDVPIPFLHEVFCKAYSLHSPPVFSNDGSEVYWTPMSDMADGIHFMRQIDGQWSEPEIVPLPFYVTGEGEPCISPDGSRLFFTAFVLWSNEKIMYMDRKGTGWGKPVSAGDKVNALNLHWQMSVNKNHDLYFQVRTDDLSDGMIYCSEYMDGEFRTPRKLGKRINTPAWENFPFIAPDDSYLIFSRTVAGKGDELMISFKDESGLWGEPINMEEINSPSHDMYPVVTPDGAYLFFLSWRDGSSCPYWVSSGIIEKLRQVGGPAKTSP